MKCDVCGKEFNNSEELKQHTEQAHPMDEIDEREVEDKDRKNPELKREMGESNAAGALLPTEGRKP